MKQVALLLTLTLLSGCAGMTKGWNSRPVHSAVDLIKIEKNPAAHSDELYAFSGEVLWVRENANSGATFQLLVEEPNIGTEYSTLARSASLLVSFPTDKSTSILEGHSVKVLGRPGDALVTGTNAFGGTAIAVPFNAIAYVDFTGGQSEYLEDLESTYKAWKDGQLYKTPWGFKIREEEALAAQK